MGEAEEWAYDLGLDDAYRRYNRRKEATMRTARTRAESSDETVSEARTTTGTRTARAGFKGYNATLSTLNSTTFRVEDDSEVIVFLDPENFHYALRHWVKYIGDDGKPATRAEWCLSMEVEDGDYDALDEALASPCPLCDIGDKPKAVAFFNVVNLANPTKVLVWEASADPTNAIQKEFNKLNKNGKSLSDDNLYWVISREQGRNGFWTYSVDRLPADDLATEWKSLKPLNGAQRDALRHRAYDESYVELKPREEIQEFVDSLG